MESAGLRVPGTQFTPSPLSLLPSFLAQLLAAGTHQDIDSLLTGSPNRYPAISAAAATAAGTGALGPWLLWVAGPAGSLAPGGVPAAGARTQT